MLCVQPAPTAPKHLREGASSKAGRCFRLDEGQSDEIPYQHFLRQRCCAEMPICGNDARPPRAEHHASFLDDRTWSGRPEHDLLAHC